MRHQYIPLKVDIGTVLWCHDVPSRGVGMCDSWHRLGVTMWLAELTTLDYADTVPCKDKKCRGQVATSSLQQHPISSKGSSLERIYKVTSTYYWRVTE